MPAALKTIGTLIAGRLGSGERVNFIVKTARSLYGGTALIIVLTWYSAWRNERVEPGTGKLPFPGWKKIKAKFGPDRPGKDTDPGWSPNASKGSSGGKVVTSAAGKSGIPAGTGGKPGPPDWGGTRKVAEALVSGLGLSVSSAKRSTELTTEGSISDHYTGCKECYALDNTGSVAQMDHGARVIISRLGGHYTGGELVYDVTRGGYRIQVLYRTYVGGNHFTHVHVGVRKVGYEP